MAKREEKEEEEEEEQHHQRKRTRRERERTRLLKVKDNKARKNPRTSRQKGKSNKENNRNRNTNNNTRKIPTSRTLRRSLERKERSSTRHERGNTVSVLADDVKCLVRYLVIFDSRLSSICWFFTDSLRFFSPSLSSRVSVSESCFVADFSLLFAEK